MTRRGAPTTPPPHAVGKARLRVVAGRGQAPDGRWYWRAEVYLDGSSTTVWSGWATAAEADEAVIQRLAGVARPVADDCRTVADLLSLWHGACEDREDLAPVTVLGYAHQARQLIARIGGVALERLDRAAVERYRDQALRAGRKPRSVQGDLKVLRLAWRWGRELGLTPAREMPQARVMLDELRRHRPTPAEVGEVLAQLHGASRLHLLLLWSTGCRIGEVAHLRWGDVLEQGGRTWLRVVGKRRVREVPLPSAAAAELAAWGEARGRDPEVHVLGRTPASAKSLLHQHLTALGVPWDPHDLRRAVVDRLYRSGVDVGTAAALVGHSPQVALRHYRRASEEDLVAAMQLAGLGTLSSGRVLPLRRTGDGGDR